MQSGYIDSNGVKIYYEIEGQGKPLILLNGGPGFPHEYLQEMRALAPHAKLVFFDQRGTGKSDKTDPRNYTIDANVEDVENLRKALNLGKCRVLGHSWGGMLAQAYILKYPENVTRLILADTFSSLEDCNAALARMRTSVSPETRAIYEKYEREGLYKNRDHYPDEYKAALEVAYAPVFMSVPPPPYLQNAFAKVAYDVYRAMWGEETEFKMTGTLKEFNVESRLKEIRVPTLVIVGANDMPTIAMAEKTARLIPKARLEVFAHSRHFPFIEEKEKFMNIVLEFLEA
ncbi:proline iminopeptidase-family hydrolase [Candidatus Acetothermia bacterium]|nr:proline iminopeptidase-family hydrolase [Candidatus Acetothermia bacterium]